MDKVRIDKWLWAARFFKTRSLAKQAIEGGKVHCNGQRIKASKDISIEAVLTIRQGWATKEVVVTALSDQRRGASEAIATVSRNESQPTKTRTRNRAKKSLKNGGSY